MLSSKDHEQASGGGGTRTTAYLRDLSGNLAQKYSFWVRLMLHRAGWRRGAQRAVEWSKLPDIPLFPAAERVLNEFFGLTVGSAGPGKDLAMARLTFNPDTLQGVSEDVIALSKQMGIQLYPLGEVDEGHAILLIDENDCTYMWYDQTPKLVARSFNDALERMLLGKKYEGNS